MLAELFLTPHAMCPDFIQDNNLHYRSSDYDQAIKLARILLRYFKPNPTCNPTTICSRLGGKKWTDAVAKRIGKIKNTDIKMMFTDILDIFNIHLDRLDRFLHQPINPEDEAAWIQAAVASSAALPLARIVGSTVAVATGNSPPFFCADQLGGQQFEFGLTCVRPVNNRGDLRKALVALCIHADEIILRTPFAHELKLLVSEIISLADQGKLAGHIQNRPKLLFHTCPYNQYDKVDVTRKIKEMVNNLGWSKGNYDIFMFQPKSFVNRYLIAQKFSNNSSPWRRMISISHLPNNGNDFGPQDQSFWSVIDASTASDILRSIGSTPKDRAVFDTNGHPQFVQV
jgi:hypothetical protein